MTHDPLPVVAQINTQTIARTSRDPEGSLLVHSLFYTIQGEGPHAGRAAFFIRLYGCNLQCPGCDTDYTSKQALHDVDDLRDRLLGVSCDVLIVITGGEPFRQNISPLVRQLLFDGYRVQVETNGTLWLHDFPIGADIVCSPKTARIHPILASRVAAYKYVLSADFVAPDGLPTIALGHNAAAQTQVARPPFDWRGPIYLQPMDVQDEDENRRNARAAARSVMAHPRYTLGSQMHKFLGLP